MYELALTTNDMLKDVSWRPRVDVEYDDKNHQMIVLADLPGLEKKDVTIEVDNGALVIKGMRHTESGDSRPAEKPVGWHNGLR